MQRINGHFVNTDATQTKVQITDGAYRNQPVTGTYLLVRDVKQGAKGAFITVQMIGDGERLPNLPEDVDMNRAFRVSVPGVEQGYTVLNGAEVTEPQLILATDYCQQQGLKYDSFRKTKAFKGMAVKGDDGRLYVRA